MTKQIQLHMQLCDCWWQNKGDAGPYGQELEKGKCLCLTSMILGHFKAAINPLSLKSHDFSVG